MKQKVREIHRNQRGLAIAAALALMVIIAAVTGGLWQALSLMEWAEQQGTATPTMPNRAQGWEWTLWGCAADSGTPASEVSAQKGTVVCPAVTTWLEEFDYRIARKDSGDRVISADVWTWEHPDGRGTYLGSSIPIPVNALVASPGNGQVQPWTTFYFTDQIVLYAGTWYTIHINEVSGSTGSWYTTGPYGSTCIGAITKGHFYENPSPGWTDTTDVDYYVKGYISSEPEVVTIGYELNLDGSVQLYGAAEVIGDMECSFLVSDDYEFVVAGSGKQYPDPGYMSGWNAGYFPFDYRLAYYQQDTQYSYRAMATAYGQTWYGEVYNFTITHPMTQLELYCSVIDNSLNNVRFESQMIGAAGRNLSYNVSIAYGTNQTQCLATNGTIAVAYNVTSDQVWFTDVASSTLFDPATTYFYRLRVAGNDSSIAHSTMKSFTTWDPDSPVWIQQIIMWINDHLGGNVTIATAQWWVVAALLAAAWTISGLLKWKWIGIIGSAAVFVWLVVNGTVPVWVVILAVLLAGWIIFKLVFTRAHEETGD